MCFSATASFTAGVGLSIVGGATLANVKRKSEIPFAAIPLLFGIQQLTEGVIWISFDRPFVLSIATFVYLFFSHVIWPTLLPSAVYLIETALWRRRVLKFFIGIGFVVSIYFLYYLFAEHVTAKVVNESVAYFSPHFFITFILSPYTAATCASCLFSSSRTVNVFGILTFFAALTAAKLYEQTFISVWCLFGAILSVMIYVHFRFEYRKT